MAINFLNSVDFNKNELLNPTIENQPNDTAAGTGVEGQLYFNTTDDILKVYANGAWVEVGGGVTSLTTTDGTYINLTPNSATTGAVTVTADLSAIDGTAGAGERYLAKSGVWATIASIPGTYTFNVEGDTGGGHAVSSGSILELFGGTYISTESYQGAGVTFNHDNTSRSDTTSTDTPGFGATFTAVTSVTTNGTGHVTSIDVSTVTVPGGGTMPDDITFDGVITAEGGLVMQGNRITDVSNPTNAQDAATKAYVDAATVGGLVYQGGYNAATNTPNLDSTPIAGIKKGWTYTVTADGLFFTEQVRVGDVLIAEVDSPTALADWTTVQNNIDIASASQIGIGNVAASTADELLGIDVTYNGAGTAAVGLDINGLPSIPNISSADLGSLEIPLYNNDTSDSNEKVDVFELLLLASKVTSYATTITDTTTMTHGLNTRDVIVQLYDMVTYETVYADVDRISTTQATITFASTPTNSVRVLVQKIG